MQRATAENGLHGHRELRFSLVCVNPWPWSGGATIELNDAG